MLNTQNKKREKKTQHITCLYQNTKDEEEEMKWINKIHQKPNKIPKIPTKTTT